MAKIFVSYARSTAELAQLIAATLRTAGHSVWIDDQLLSHRMFSDTIEAELNAADAVVVVWSDEAARSEWVRAEASRARKANKLVQVRFGRSALPMPFDQIHVVDLEGWKGDYEMPAWRAVLASIAAVTGGSGGPALKAPVANDVQVAGDRRSERRQITALFCDLVDAETLAARLDPEDMMDILDIYQSARDEIIAHHGGSIAEASNHGMLAYFGYPRADEHEAANAVRAGLEICAAVQRLALPAGVTLQVSVGLATGLVVIADLARGGPGRTAGAVGETPTLAKRLQALARPNSVVVAASTRRIAEGLFRWSALEPASLPGHDRPVSAFCVTGATDAASRSQARLQNSQNPMFGREQELALMRQCWALAAEGEGQVVLVQGEPGIGKSRLIEAFRAHVREAGGLDITWFCAPNYSDSALYPVIDQLRRSCGFADGDDNQVRREKLLAFLDRLGLTAASSQGVIASLLNLPAEGEDIVAALTPERRKAVTLDTLLVMMQRAAVDAPALFIIEDLHWADPTTLELLDRATRLAADQPWLILGTARLELESRWFDTADVTHVKLARLAPADAAQICSALGADHVLPAELFRQIMDRSDGNPLFIEELTKSVLEGFANSASGVDTSHMAIPMTLQDSLAARLDRLGTAKQAASLGAAIGRRFSYELLAAVSSLPAAELRQALRELARADIVVRNGVPPKSYYIFKHALIRDAAYSALLKRERDGLHGRIAAALREQFPDVAAAEPALMAHHLTESGAIAEAVQYWTQAGQQAAAQAAHAEAAAHFQAAISLVRRLPADTGRSQMELPLLLALAASLSAARGYAVPEVGQLLEEALGICSELGNAPELYGVLRVLSSFYVTTSDLPMARAVSERCLQIAEQTLLPAHRIETATANGVIATYAGDFADALQWMEQALALYRAHSGTAMVFHSVPDALCVCLSFLPLVKYAMGDKAGAELISIEVIAHIANLDRKFDRVFCLCWHAYYDFIRGEYLRAAASSREAQDICEENGYDTFAIVASLFQAGIKGSLNNTPEAASNVRHSIEALDRLGVRSMGSHHWSLLGRLQFASGNQAAAMASFQRAIDHAERFNDRFFLSPIYRLQAEILAAMPDADRSAVTAALEKAVSVAEAQGAAGFADDARLALARLAA